MSAACNVPDCGTRRCSTCDDRMTCLGPEPHDGGQCVDCWREEQALRRERDREWWAS